MNVTLTNMCSKGESKLTQYYGFFKKGNKYMYAFAIASYGNRKLQILFYYKTIIIPCVKLIEKYIVISLKLLI